MRAGQLSLLQLQNPNENPVSRDPHLDFSEVSFRGKGHFKRGGARRDDVFD